MKMLKDQKGFTLVEALIVLLVTGIILIGLGSMVRVTHQSYEATRENTESQQAANFAMEMIVRDLRQAISVSPVTNPTVITFINENNQTVRYSWNAATRQLFRNSEILAENISGFQISTSSTNLYRIGLTAQVESQLISLENSVRPRNL